jgi:hypothetical protein
MTQAVHVLLNGATAAGTGDACAPGDRLAKVVKAELAGAGATAEVRLYGNTRNANTGGILLATITLASATPRDGFSFDAPWPFMYAELVSVTGGGSVTVDLGV